jgi:hypothetical protein
MKQSFAIGIPTLNRSDLLNPSLEKYFNQFPQTSIFIIDNGNQNLVSRENNFKVFKPKKNLGVARSWNYLCDEIFKDHEYALILNDDIYIDLNQSEVNDFALGQKVNLVKCQEEFNFCSFILSKKCFTKHRFDESFYPAYFEDKDYFRRLKISGINVLEHFFLNPKEYLNSASSSEEGGDPNILSSFANLYKRYIDKWGGPPGQEIFLSEFNQSPNQSKTIEIIAVTYKHGYKLKCFIDSIRSQSCDNWYLNIIHDGKGELFEETKNDLLKNGYLNHPNISFRSTETRHNDYGHSLRDFGLKNPISNSDYTLITNCDNYYCPEWLSTVNNWLCQDLDFVYWDCVHNHSGNTSFDRLYPYGLNKSELKEGFIDMGSVAVKTSIAQSIGFPFKQFNGDWHYFHECLKKCKPNSISKVPCVLFTHN